MSDPRWSAVDEYVERTLLPADPVLAATLSDSAAAGLPPIQVAPNQGKFLMLLAQLQRASRILEIGTLGGYSTIWLARGLTPGGKLITLEADPTHAAVARKNFARGGLADTIELRLGRAADSLPRLIEEQQPPFDLIFIDADKPSTADYFSWAMQLARVGTLIIVDNVVRQGQVIDGSSPDDRVQGIRRFMERLASDRRISATALQTVGGKGYDGFVMGVVTSLS